MASVMLLNPPLEVYLQIASPMALAPGRVLVAVTDPALHPGLHLVPGLDLGQFSPALAPVDGLDLGTGTTKEETATL